MEETGKLEEINKGHPSPHKFEAVLMVETDGYDLRVSRLRNTSGQWMYEKLYTGECGLKGFAALLHLLDLGRIDAKEKNKE